MKHLITAFFVLSCALPAMAADTTCKKSGEAIGQGYEVVISGKSASLLYKSKEIATLKLQSSKPSPGGDQQAVAKYAETTTNGYALTLTSGGLTGLKSVSIEQHGFVGVSEVDTLNDCK